MAYPLRIEKPSTIVAMSDEKPDAIKEYVDRLVRLVPAEALAAYQAIHGIVEQAAKTSKSAVDAIPWLPLLGIAFVLIVRVWGTRATGGALATVQWGATGIAVVSFVILVLSLGQPFLTLPPTEPWMNSVLVICWIFVVPYFYKGE